MAGVKRDLDRSGCAVAANVRRLRKQRGFTYTSLSEHLVELGRPIPALGVRRIEEGGRRVDADDLIALAIALGVSPATLLMPESSAPDQKVQVTGCPDGVNAASVWEWLTDRQPLSPGTTQGQAGSDCTCEPLGGEHYVSCPEYEPPLTHEEVRHIRAILAPYESSATVLHGQIGWSPKVINA